MALVHRRTSPQIADIASVHNSTRGALVGSNIHRDASELTVTATNGVDLATSLALVNQMKAVYEFHRKDTVVHAAADTTNVESVTNGVDLATGIALANDLKAQYNAHLSQMSVHDNNDGANSVGAANATDLASLETLVNQMKTKLNAHMAAALGGQSLRVVAA